MSRRRALLAGLVLALVAPAPVPALAATASVTTRSHIETEPHTGDFTVTESQFTYTAGAGEANAPVLTFSADLHVLEIHDPGAAITPGAGCTGAGGADARCEAPAIARPLRMTVALGDGDDALGPFTSPSFTTIDAGPGADTVEVASGVVEGAEGDDVLRSSGRSASLAGGPGADTILGGPGGDSIDGGPGSDRLDGGPGTDIVSWANETLPVTVDLSQPGPAGSAAEPDDVRNFEGAGGGTGADVLRGTDGANQLLGGGGNDLLIGRSGDDSLSAGPGADHLLGGAGADEVVNVEYVPAGEADTLEGGAGDDVVRDLSTGGVLLGGPGADTLEFQQGALRADGGSGNDSVEAFELGGSSAFIACGSGRDGISGLRGTTLVPPDCELVTSAFPGEPSVSARVRLRGGALTIPVAAVCGGSRCRMTITVRAGTRIVARRVRRLRVRDGQARTLTLRLGPAARRRILAAGRVRLDYRAPEALRPFTMTVRPVRG